MPIIKCYFGRKEERRQSDWVSFQHCDSDLPEVSSACNEGTLSSLEWIPATCVQYTENIFVLDVEHESKPTTLGKIPHLLLGGLLPSLLLLFQRQDREQHRALCKYEIKKK